jgi:hypothetical protein
VAVLRRDELRRARDPDVDRLLASAQLERPPFEAVRLEPGGLGRHLADEQLARACHPGDSRRRVDRVAERGEVDRVALTDRSDERDARVDADADRDPGIAAVVAGSLQQVAAGGDRLRRVLLAAKPGMKSATAASPTNLSTMPS